MFPNVESFYDPSTGTVSHIVYEGEGSPCAIIDPVLDDDKAVEEAAPEANPCEPLALTYEELLPYLLLPIGWSY